VGFLSSFAGAVDCRVVESLPAADALAEVGAITNDPSSNAAADKDAAADKPKMFNDLL
jgi:hypothetical protein